jgi:flavin reductase (DIM6/NTAB) family NADH-FMN oxidoreductase RutF
MIDSPPVAKREIPREQAYRLLSGGPLALVTSYYRGDMNVMTAGWITPASYRPILIALSVHQATLTHELISRSSEFVLNIPTLDLLRQVHYCGTVSGRDQNKLKETGLHEAGPHVVRPVLIDECIAHLECAVVDTFAPGDHTLFLAEIVHASAESEAFEQTYLLTERDLKPLHHLGADRYSVLDAVETAPAVPGEEE